MVHPETGLKGKRAKFHLARETKESYAIAISTRCDDTGVQSTMTLELARAPTADISKLVADLRKAANWLEDRMNEQTVERRSA